MLVRSMNTLNKSVLNKYRILNVGGLKGVQIYKVCVERYVCFLG